MAVWKNRESNRGVWEKVCGVMALLVSRWRSWNAIWFMCVDLKNVATPFSSSFFSLWMFVCEFLHVVNGIFTRIFAEYFGTTMALFILMCEREKLSSTYEMLRSRRVYVYVFQTSLEKRWVCCRVCLKNIVKHILSFFKIVSSKKSIHLCWSQRFIWIV